MKLLQKQKEIIWKLSPTPLLVLETNLSESVFLGSEDYFSYIGETVLASRAVIWVTTPTISTLEASGSCEWCRTRGEGHSN